MTKEIVSSNSNPISLKLIINIMMMSNDEACHKVMAMIREVKLQIRDTYVAVYKIDLQLKWHIANKKTLNCCRCIPTNHYTLILLRSPHSPNKALDF